MTCNSSKPQLVIKAIESDTRHVHIVLDGAGTTICYALSYKSRNIRINIAGTVSEGTHDEARLIEDNIPDGQPSRVPKQGGVPCCRVYLEVANDVSLPIKHASEVAGLTLSYRVSDLREGEVRVEVHSCPIVTLTVGVHAVHKIRELCWGLYPVLSTNDTLGGDENKC